MYEYRKLSSEERQVLVQERLARGFPPHKPPHPIRDERDFLLTAACYEHAHHLQNPERRRHLLDQLFEVFTNQGIEIRAWVILTNHYHLLSHVPDFDVLFDCFRLVHGRTAFAWNREDDAKGRKVWYRFADRAIRSDRHFYTTLNYIHYNPVKHSYVTSPYDWEESSVHWYLAESGRDWLRDVWRTYPVRDYGKGWDDI